MDKITFYHTITSNKYKLDASGEYLSESSNIAEYTVLVGSRIQNIQQCEVTREKLFRTRGDADSAHLSVFLVKNTSMNTFKTFSRHLPSSTHHYYRHRFNFFVCTLLFLVIYFVSVLLEY